MNPTSKRPDVEERFLQSIRDAGGWLPVPTPLLKDAIDHLLKTFSKENPAPKWLAMLDIMHAADDGPIGSIAFFQQRWRWSRKRTYRLLCDVGLKGLATEGERQGNDNPQNQDDLQDTGNGEGTEEKTEGEEGGNDEGTMRERRGNDEGTARERQGNDNTEKQEEFEDLGNGKGTARERQGNDEGTMRERTGNGLSIYSARDRIESESEEEGKEKKEEDAREKKIEAEPEVVLGVWTEETYPLYRRWVEMTGKSVIDRDIEYTIRLLLRPAGSGLGARLPRNDPLYSEGQVFCGYTPEDILRGLEDLLTSKHYSAASLIKHVAGIMPSRGNHERKHSAPSGRELADELNADAADLDFALRADLYRDRFEDPDD